MNLSIEDPKTAEVGQAQPKTASHALRKLMGDMNNTLSFSQRSNENSTQSCNQAVTAIVPQLFGSNAIINTSLSRQGFEEHKKTAHAMKAYVTQPMVFGKQSSRIRQVKPVNFKTPGFSQEPAQATEREGSEEVSKEQLSPLSRFNFSKMQLNSVQQIVLKNEKSFFNSRFYNDNNKSLVLKKIKDQNLVQTNNSHRLHIEQHDSQLKDFNSIIKPSSKSSGTFLTNRLKATQRLLKRMR